MGISSTSAGWTGTAVLWVLVATLATVAAIAARRLFLALRGGGSALASGPGLGSGWVRPAVHLAMALGMALMVMPRGTIVPDSVLRDGFGALGVVLAAGSFALARGRHGLHHAAMCGVMALMAAPARGGAAGAMAPGMVMPPSPSGAGGGGPSTLLLAAFGYACALTLAFACRMPHRTPDPLGHACEVTMLTSTVVMLLPML